MRATLLKSLPFALTLLIATASQAQVKIGVAGPITGANAAFGAQLTQGVRAGGRGYQQGGRHSRPKARGRAGRRRVGSQAGRFGRQQVRRRRRQVRGRPLQLGRDDSGLRRLRGERRPLHHPLGDQPEGHRPHALGRVPHLRPRRPAGHGLGRARPRQAQGQEDRGRARQDDLRQGPRRRRARQHAQVRRQGGALRRREHRREGLFGDRVEDQGVRRRLSDVGRPAHRRRPHHPPDARPGHEDRHDLRRRHHRHRSSPPSAARASRAR